MNKLNIELTNCFGIDSLKHEFDFGKKHYLLLMILQIHLITKDLSKSQEVCRTYDAIQSTYADILQNDNSIQEIRCNVLLDGLAEGAYTSDFVCVKADGDLMVRECIFRKFLTKPMTVKLLDASRDYWLKHGVSDWGIVIDEE